MKEINGEYFFQGCRVTIGTERKIAQVVELEIVDRIGIGIHLSLFFKF